MAKLQIKQLYSTNLINCEQQEQVNIIGGLPSAYIASRSKWDSYSYTEIKEYLWKGYAQGKFFIEIGRPIWNSRDRIEAIIFYDSDDKERYRIGFIRL